MQNVEYFMRPLTWTLQKFNVMKNKVGEQFYIKRDSKYLMFELELDPEWKQGVGNKEY